MQESQPCSIQSFATAYMYTIVDFSQKYPYLSKHMTKEVCDAVFRKEQVMFTLATTPPNGFYANLLAYQKANYPSLTNREVGSLLSRIDPQFAATVGRPENTYKKIHRIACRKGNMDKLVSYTRKRKNACSTV